MNNNFFDEDQEMVDRLLNDLEFNKPSMPEMLKDIKETGLAIKLENANVNFFESHKEEIITSMWKAVKVAIILKQQNIQIMQNLNGQMNSPVFDVNSKLRKRIH